VLPELLVGAYPALDDLAWLATAHGVGAVLNLQNDFDLAAKRLTLAALEAGGAAAALAFARHPVPDGDAPGLARALPDLVALLDRLIAAYGCVYLHCNAGMNRAPTVAIAYLHDRRALPLAEAIGFVKARRVCLPYVGALEAAYPAPASLRGTQAVSWRRP
jgi:atypical dual specificity phosphatase